MKQHCCVGLKTAHLRILDITTCSRSLKASQALKHVHEESFYLLLNKQIVSNICEQMSPLLYAIHTKYTKNRMFPCSTPDSHSESAWRTAPTPPQERSSSPLPWDSIEPEAKETSIHKASKQQMASTGNLPLERLRRCLHIFLNSLRLYQNACLFRSRSTQKRQRKATCKALNRKLREVLKRTYKGG